MLGYNLLSYSNRLNSNSLLWFRNHCNLILIRQNEIAASKCCLPMYATSLSDGARNGSCLLFMLKKCCQLVVRWALIERRRYLT